MRCLVAALTCALGLTAATVAAQEAPPPQKSHGPALFDEPGVMTSAIDFASRSLGQGDGGGKDGLYLQFGGMVTGAGWLALGPGYRTRILNDRAIVDASAAASWRTYKTAQARFEIPRLARGRLAVGSHGLWQDLTQLNYFGVGPDSLEKNRSEYRLQTTNVVGYANYRPVRWLALGGRFGWLDQPELSASTGSFDRGYPNAQVTFAHEPAMTLERQPSFFHWDISVTADTRNHPAHPSRGALYRAAWTTFADRDLDAFDFRRYEVEGLHVLPLAGDAWILALHGWGVFSDTSPGQSIPVYLLPGLGGANTLRGHPNYRFHDRHLLLSTIESRWPLFQHIDVAAFADVGGVAARVPDLTLDQRSYGAGLRLHSHTATTARIDVARGSAGWQVLFRLNDPFRLDRAARRTAPVPFVP